jgi:hypothetical protein
MKLLIGIIIGCISLMIVGGAVKMAIMDPIFSNRLWYPKYNRIHGKCLLGLTAILFQDVVLIVIKLFWNV